MTPRDDIRPEDLIRTLPSDHAIAAKGSGLPQRMFAGPATCTDATRSMLNLLRRRNLTGLAFDIEFTGIGATGDHAKDDEEALLDSVAELLITMFRGSDLIARTGPRTFLIIAAPVPNEVSDHLSRRLSNRMSSLTTDWRSHGLATCCAINQFEVSPTASDNRFRLTDDADIFAEIVDKQSSEIEMSVPPRAVPTQCSGVSA